MGPSYGSLLLTLSLIVGCDGPAATDSGTADGRGRPSASAKGPIAEFEDVTLDLGEVPLRSHSDHLEAIIRVKNAGDEPLRFDRLVMSCGCTEAKPMQEEIAAGETGEIAVRIEVTTSGSRDFDANGNFSGLSSRNLLLHRLRLCASARHHQTVETQGLVTGVLHADDRLQMIRMTSKRDLTQIKRHVFEFRDRPLRTCRRSAPPVSRSRIRGRRTVTANDQTQGQQQTPVGWPHLGRPFRS